MKDVRITEQDERIGTYGPWFRSFLKARGIGLSRTCPFAIALRDLERLRAGIQTGVPYTVRLLTERARERFLTGALGADLFTTLLYSVIDKIEERFDGHWRYFQSADAIPTRGGDNSTANNRLWELFVGAALAGFASDLRVEEPDLTFTFLNSRWGAACKTLHSDGPRAHLKRFVEGGKQIERADVQHGVVVANLANLVPQRLFLRVPDADPATLMRSGENMGQGILNAVPREELTRRLSVGSSGPRDRTRAILAFCPILVPIHGQANLQCATLLYEFRRVQHQMDWEFAMAFRESLRTTMSGPIARH